MTTWRIQKLPDMGVDARDEDSANLDDGSGLGHFDHGWWEAWEYIAGNCVPGDTVEVLEEGTEAL
jgi:hypothetical protein